MPLESAWKRLQATFLASGYPNGPRPLDPARRALKSVREFWWGSLQKTQPEGLSSFRPETSKGICFVAEMEWVSGLLGGAKISAWVQVYTQYVVRPKAIALMPGCV